MKFTIIPYTCILLVAFKTNTGILGHNQTSFHLHPVDTWNPSALTLNSPNVTRMLPNKQRLVSQSLNVKFTHINRNL